MDNHPEFIAQSGSLRPSAGAAPAFGGLSGCRHRLAYTLIEMLTTVALLVIVLGLMVSLARYVRERSATELTKDLLHRLDHLMSQYAKRNGGVLPAVTPFAGDGPLAEEMTLQRNGRKNNEDVVRALRRQEALSAGPLNDLPISIYDEVTIRDAWGNPIVFMAKWHREIGTAPGDRFFFFSAGPDRQYRTRDDNLYSYEGVR